MSVNLVTSAWAPGLIGLAIAGLMYGVSLAQSVYYAWRFPNDPIFIRSLVLLIFIADAVHLVGTTEFFWNMLVLCHRSHAATCDIYLPWGAYAAIPMNYIITFAVQSFYCNRIWIITGKRRSITVIVLFIVVLQLALGTWAFIATLKDGTLSFLYSTPLIPLTAGVSTVCDVIITSTIFKCLWWSEHRHRNNVIRDLVVVFINMGALTCLISLTVCVVYFVQGNHYWVGAPAAVLCRCYVNSLLAVLNARQRIRERELRRYRYPIEIPTLSTVL